MNKIQTFGSIMTASRQLDLERRNIGACCNNKQKTCGGFIFKFAKDEPTYIQNENKRRKIVQDDVSL